MNSDLLLEPMIRDLEDLHDNSRIWIYQADRNLTNEEVDFTRFQLNSFTQQWTSHNRSLQAKGLVLYNRFVLVVLDEQASSSASGCSIDSQVHFIQQLGNHLKADLMNRDLFIFLKEGGVKAIHMHSLKDHVEKGEISLKDKVFNNLVKTVAELKEGWQVSLEDSWHSRFI